MSSTPQAVPRPPAKITTEHRRRKRIDHRAERARARSSLKVSGRASGGLQGWILHLAEERTETLLDSSAEQRDLWDRIAAGYSPDDAVETEAIAGTLDFLQELSGGGTALEFAVGGGRIAVPLYRRGVRVHGMDVSPGMIDVLHAAVPADELLATVGSMATDAPPGTDYQLIYIVYNAITCLLHQDEQIACFQNAARHLRPGGHFVIEVWVPQLRQLPPGQTLVPGTATKDRLIIDSYDLVSQRLVSQHYTLKDGKVIDSGGTPHRYVWPSEMDVMAKMAGLELTNRYADWTRSEFTGDSKSGISVWTNHPDRGSQTDASASGRWRPSARRSSGNLTGHPTER